MAWQPAQGDNLSHNKDERGQLRRLLPLAVNPEERLCGSSTLCTKSIFLSTQHKQGRVITAAAQGMSRWPPAPRFQHSPENSAPGVAQDHLPSPANGCLRIPEETQGTQILAAGHSPAGTGNFFLRMPESARGQRKGGLSLTTGSEMPTCPINNPKHKEKRAN